MVKTLMAFRAAAGKLHTSSPNLARAGLLQAAFLATALVSPIHPKSRRSRFSRKRSQFHGPSQACPSPFTQFLQWWSYEGSPLQPATPGLPRMAFWRGCSHHFGGTVPTSMDGTRQPASLSIVPMLARAVPPPTTNSPSSGLATCQYLGASTRSHMFRQTNLDTRKQYGRREESALSAEPSRRVSSSAAPAQTSNDNNNNNNYPFDMRKPLPTHWQFQPYLAYQTTTTNNARYYNVN